MSSEIAAKLRRLIQATGPLSIADYMHYCLSAPRAGYYQSGEIFGAKGDFVTAPEISQMFGELIGAWCIHVWESIGKPDSIRLVELGPGNGNLMADLLRAAGSKPQFFHALEVHLVETSEELGERQKALLGNRVQNIEWHLELASICEEQKHVPTILIANEFLDAIPIRQFVKGDEGWFERVVGIPDGDDDAQFVHYLSQAKIDPNLLPENHEGEPSGAVFEYSPAREALIQQISEQIAMDGGAALLIDYGHAKSGFGDTLQAVYNHQYADIFESPGHNDLSSHVDFQALARVAESYACNVHPVITQGDFLLKMGLLERAGQLGGDKTKEEQARLVSQVERLAGPDQMGELFKCLCITQSDINPVPFSDQ